MRDIGGALSVYIPIHASARINADADSENVRASRQLSRSNFARSVKLGNLVNFRNTKLVRGARFKVALNDFRVNNTTEEYSRIKSR